MTLLNSKFLVKLTFTLYMVMVFIRPVPSGLLYRRNYCIQKEDITSTFRRCSETVQAKGNYSVSTESSDVWPDSAGALLSSKGNVLWHLRKPEAKIKVHITCPHASHQISSVITQPARCVGVHKKNWTYLPFPRQGIFLSHLYNSVSITT